MRVAVKTTHKTITYKVAGVPNTVNSRNGDV